MGDTCRQVSWLAALGVTPCASPPPSRRMPAVASGATLAAYSCGGSRGFETNRTSHRVPFSPPQPNTGLRRDRHAEAIRCGA